MKTQSARTLAAQFATSPALKPIALAVALALTSPHAVFAAPTGATVVAGQAQVTQPNAQTTLVKQGSDKAIINWRSFSIAAGQTVDFQQPNSSSVALNRVTTPTPSEIFGRLSANGKVFLVNPSGVLFGRGASVDVGGLVASTLNISDADFLAGRFSFSDGGGSAGAVRNDGTLAAAERGTIALLGAQVSNNGTITARLGTVGLAAGGKVSLDFNGDGLTRIVVDAARINALVENGGAVISEGGQVIMTARAVAALADTVVRHDGIVKANSLVERNGRIVLDGGSAGKVEVAGMVEASGLGAGARGGDVTVIGKDLILAGSSTIDVRGDAGGGAVLAGGDYQGGNPLIPHASSTTMAAGATIRADALGNGDGGKVILWSDNASSVHGSVSARAGALGGDGGLVETSGRSVDDIGMRVNASSAKGKAGTWLVDPENRTVDATLAASIAATLDNGTNYTLRTNDHDFEERGDINVNANIIKAAGGNVKLTLEADHDIIVAAGVQIASTSPTGKLDVDFNANARGTANTGITIDEAFGEGAIVMKAGSSIKSNGGDIRFYGQSDPIQGFARGNTYNRDGIRLNNVTLDTRTGGVDSGAGGNVSMRAIGDFDHDDQVADGAPGIIMADSSILSSTGNINMTAYGGSGLRRTNADGTITRSDGGIGVDLQLSGPAKLSTTSGSLTIYGEDGSTWNTSGGLRSFGTLGVQATIFYGGSIESQNGIVDITGVSDGIGGQGAAFSLSNGHISAAEVLLNGEGHESSNGVSVGMFDSNITAGTGMVINGDAGTNGNGISLFMTNSAFTAGSGLVFNGSGGVNGDGISVDMSDSSITAGAGMVFNGDARTYGNGIAVHMTNFGIYAGSSIMLNGSAGQNGDGISLFADGATISAADIAFNGDALENGDGIRGVLIVSAAVASNGQLTMNGTGGGPGAGVKLDMDRSSIGANHGNVEINGTGGDRVGSGVVISSSQEEGGGDGSFGKGGVMSGSSADIYSDHGKIAIAGTNGFATPSSGPSMMTQVNGVKLTGIELKAVQGDIRVAGTALPGTNLVPTGVALTNVMASTASGPENLAPGNVEIRAVTNGPAPALALDGVTLGGAAMGGDIIVAARNAGPGQMITYGDASSFHNAVQTSGIINLRPDDLGFGDEAVAGTAIPITIGGPAANFNVAFTSLGIGRSSAANVVVGSREHTAAITFDDPAPFLGKLTLQNDGAGSEGIALASNMNVQGQVTLSTGGAVEGAESAINAASLLLRGTQPESNFQLTNPGNRVAMFAARFDTNKGLASPAYGDVNYTNNGALAIAPMAGTSFSSAANVASTVDAADTVVAGDLLVRTSGDLTLGSNVSTRGSAITLVIGGTFQNISNSALSPGGGDSWRVFADTWVGEVRGGLTPPSPHPNYYNCAYGAPCSDAITGSHFIYRAQPVLTLQANNFARAYGDPIPALTFTQSGLVNGDTLADVASGAYATSAGTSSAVGAYPIGGTFTSPVGYAIDARPGTLTVDRAALLISVDDKNKIYGGVDPAPSATFSGFKNGENSSVICCLNLATATGAAATAGIHPIVGANANAANYSISYVPGTLTVAKAPLTIAADNKSTIYGDAEPPLTASFTGLKYSDTGAVVTGLTLSTATGAAATAGAFPIVAGNGSAANYSLSYVPAVLTVDKAPLVITADNKVTVYGAADPLLSAAMTGFKYADTSAVVSGLTLTAPTGAAAVAGNFPIVAANASASNYAPSYVPGVLAVAPAVLMYVADGSTQFQDAPARPLTGTVTGFVYNDTLASATTGSLAFSAPATPLSPPGVYAVHGSGLAAANYRFIQARFNDTALTLLPSPIIARPTILRNVTFESSNVYEKNFGLPRLCVGTAPLGLAGADRNDALALEWSRVRVSPNLSNCIGLGQRNSCSDF